MKVIDTVIPALKMAKKTRPIMERLIFRSDRGVQYACNDFEALLDANPLVCRNMSRKGIAGIMRSRRAFLKHSKQSVYTSINSSIKNKQR